MYGGFKTYYNEPKNPWSVDFEKCDGCNNYIHPEYAMYRGKYYLCYECSRKRPDKDYNALVPNLVQLMMRREMGESLSRAQVNTVTSSTDGMKLRYKTVTDTTFSNLFSKNEIIVHNPPERNDKMQFARKIVKLMGIEECTVESATEIWLPQLSNYVTNKYYNCFKFNYLPIGKAHLLIRLCPDWRNRRRKECNLGPNDIILRGIPEADTTDLRNTRFKTDKFLIRLVARNTGVYIEQDMFTAIRVALKLTTCTDNYCGPELPRALLISFKNHVVKETLAKAFRNRKDLFERVPNDFATLNRMCQKRKRKFYCRTRHVCSWKMLRHGGVIGISSNIGNGSVLVLISNDEGHGSCPNFEENTTLFPDTEDVWWEP